MVRVLKFDHKECLKLGLLRKIPPSKEKAEMSIKTAKRWLNEAENNINGESYTSSLISSYLAMFHSSRAILFFDGFREKSHACIARYLEDVYVKNGLLEKKWVELLDHHRELRHEGQYSFGFISTKEESERILETVKEFVERMKMLLEKLEKTKK